MKIFKQTLWLLGLIIIGAVTLSSCEDDFTENDSLTGRWTDETTAYIFEFSDNKILDIYTVNYDSTIRFNSFHYEIIDENTISFENENTESFNISYSLDEDCLQLYNCNRLLSTIVQVVINKELFRKD